MVIVHRRFAATPSKRVAHDGHSIIRPSRLQSFRGTPGFIVDVLRLDKVGIPWRGPLEWSETMPAKTG